jgi:hypothetical protein
MADQPSPRRRFQFRLRTLMIGVTLLAVACWVAVDRARLIRERDEAELRATVFETEASNLVQSGILADITGTLEFPANTPPEIIAETKRTFPRIQVSIRAARP